jgi:3-methyl-2-oxobutanoate hydroxymethyltransferase
MDPHTQAVSKVTVPSLHDRKLRGERIVCLTAYDYPSARLVDEAGADLLLVGDSLAQVALGYDSTVPVTLEEMLHHLRAVRRGVRRALLVLDLPFGSYQGSEHDALAAAIQALKTGAEAVKIEGGRKRASLIRRMVDAEVPVMGHIGLTPQSVHALGGYPVQGKTFESANDLIADAQAVEDAGAFAIVLEGVPRELARIITARLRIPTIGIGAGPDCDGQILVTNDLLGLSFQKPAKFVRTYTQLAETISRALREYRDDVLAGRYPDDRESYHWPAGLVEAFEKWTVSRSSKDQG